MTRSGESYGGKYVPAFAYKIHQENQKGVNPKINLKGISIGGNSSRITCLIEDRWTHGSYYPVHWILRLADEFGICR